MPTLTPAYGRDPKTSRAALDSWEAGEDWVIADITNPWNGKPCSKRDKEALGAVMLRFNGLKDILHV
jgi:hypothetical protein